MRSSLLTHQSVEITSIPYSLLDALNTAFSSNKNLLLDLKRNLCLTHPYSANWNDKFTIKLIKGSTNTNYLIQGNNFIWLARPASYEKKAVGILPNKEKRIIKKISHTVLAPRLICVTSHWLILEWIEGTPLDTITKEASSEKLLSPLSKLISKIHQQQLSGYYIDLKKIFIHLYSNTCTKRRQHRWHRLHKLLLSSSYPTKSPLVFDHMDVHLGNLILMQPPDLVNKTPTTQNPLMLIDWEYAGDINQHFALLSLFNALNLSKKSRLLFLKFYYSKNSTDNAITDLNIHLQYNNIIKWQIWYDYLIHLWYEVRWNQTQDDTFLLEKPKSSLFL